MSSCIPSHKNEYLNLEHTSHKLSLPQFNFISKTIKSFLTSIKWKAQCDPNSSFEFGNLAVHLLTSTLCSILFAFYFRHTQKKLSGKFFFKAQKLFHFFFFLLFRGLMMSIISNHQLGYWWKIDELKCV